MKQQTDTVPVYQVLPRLGWTIFYYVMLIAALLNLAAVLVVVAVGITWQEWRWASLFGCAMMFVIGVCMVAFAANAIDLWEENGE